MSYEKNRINDSIVIMEKENQSAVIFVFNNENKLLLQLRCSSDNSYPSHWDFSATRGMGGGEDHKQSAARELKEEIGIETNLEYIGQEQYEDETGKDLLYIYKVIHNGPFDLDSKEVDKVKFFTIEEIEKMINTGEKFHPEFIFVWSKGLFA